MKRWQRSGFVFVLLAAMLLAACTGGGKGTENKNETGTPKDPKFGGIFKAALTSPAPSLDVMSNISAATRQSTLFMLEGLVAYSEDYKITGVLAEKWDVSPDGKTYTFTLRKGVKFHNGKEMTSDDVIASTKRFMNVTPRKAQFGNVESYEAKDAHTVIFKLTQPSVAFLDAVAYPVGAMVVLPKEIIEGKEADKLTNEEIIGTGPYKLAEWKPDQAVVLKRFDDYKPLPGEPTGLGGARIPYFDEIRLMSVPEAGQRVAGLETGEYDFADDIPTTEYDRLSKDPNIQTYVMVPQTWSVILFNHANQFSNNLKFRQAVQAALDMDAIAAAVSNGKQEFGRTGHSMWFNESPWFNDAGKELYNQKNTDKAKQLLKDSGYNGEEIVMVTNRNYDYMYKSIVAAGDQLKKNLGMNVKVEVLDWPGQRQRWTQKSGWHMSVTGYLSQGIFAPDAFSSIYYSTANSAERGFYVNTEIDKSFDKAISATSVAERKEAFTNVQKLFHEDVAGIRMVDSHGLVALRKDVKGYKPWYNTARFWSLWREK